MAKATQIVHLSPLFRDPALRAVFAKAERDIPPQPLSVENRPEPALSGGAAAVADRGLELA
jgi:hypothetical protein